MGSKAGAKSGLIDGSLAVGVLEVGLIAVGDGIGTPPVGSKTPAGDSVVGVTSDNVIGTCGFGFDDTRL